MVNESEICLVTNNNNNILTLEVHTLNSQGQGFTLYHMLLQPFEGQGLLNDWWLHIYISADRSEISSIQFRGSSWSFLIIGLILLYSVLYLAKFKSWLSEKKQLPKRIISSWPWNIFSSFISAIANGQWVDNVTYVNVAILSIMTLWRFCIILWNYWGIYQPLTT